jgi:hypothetical protein
LKNRFINAEDKKIYPSSESATAGIEGTFKRFHEKETTNNLTEAVFGVNWFSVEKEKKEALIFPRTLSYCTLSVMRGHSCNIVPFSVLQRGAKSVKPYVKMAPNTGPPLVYVTAVIREGKCLIIKIT